MQKNKVINILIRILKTMARVLILNIPAVIILLILMAFHKLSWISAGISLLGFWGISGIIVFYVFKDLDNFMIYLKKLAQGFEPELPKLHWGIFSSMRLTKTFLSVKNIWSDQFLSDSTVLQNLPNPLIMLDPKQKIVFANTSARQMFGKKILQTQFKDPILQPDVFFVLSKQSQSKTIQEWEHNDLKGITHTFQVKIELLPAPTHTGAIIAISFFDITPFKLFKVQQADFFANASHELKTPLAIISGCVETLQGPAKDDTTAHKQFLTLIAEQTDRMTQLVQNMLKLSKLQLDVPLTETKQFVLSDLVQKAVEDMSIRAKTLHKRIEFKSSSKIPLFTGNRDNLYHVFQNLIDNALKYSADRSKIKIFIKYDNLTKNIVVSVHNEGNPIPAESLNRIFDKFYRVDSDKAQPIEGTGLGLGISQNIVQKHGGHIDVESSKSKGTTFFVYLPVAE